MSQTVFTDKDFVERLTPIAKQFKETERAIKSAEQCETSISLTALNQAKNAFNHLCLAISFFHAGDIASVNENLNKSLGHCKRSFYDACDAEITFCISQINLFISHCRNEGLLLSEIIPDYANIASLIIQVKHFLEIDQFDIEDKNDRYKVAESHRNSIKTMIYEKLPGYYEVANEQIAKIQGLEQKNSLLEAKADSSLKWAKISGVVAIFSILISILLVYFDTDIKKFRNSKTKDDPDVSQEVHAK